VVGGRVEVLQNPKPWHKCQSLHKQAGSAGSFSPAITHHTRSKGKRIEEKRIEENEEESDEAEEEAPYPHLI
jgi:hypothetical protein